MSRPIPCCEMMQADLDRVCERHPDRSDCPDMLIDRFRDGRFGLLVHDGGSSMILIAFCPWCGSELPGGEPTPRF